MPNSGYDGKTGIFGRVTYSRDAGYVVNAEVKLTQKSPAKESITYTDPQGRFEFSDVAGEDCTVECTAFGTRAVRQGINVPENSAFEVNLKLNIKFEIVPAVETRGTPLSSAIRAVVGHPLLLHADWGETGRSREEPPPHQPGNIEWRTIPATRILAASSFDAEVLFGRSGRASVVATATEFDPTSRSSRRGTGAELSTSAEMFVSEPEATTIRGNVGVTLQRTASDPTLDQVLWVVIRNRSEALSFGRYRSFINRVLRWEENDRFPLPRALERELRDVRELRDLGTNLHGIGAYKVLKTATEIFLLLECGVPADRDFPNNSPRINLLEEQARLGEPVTAEDIAVRLKQYLGDPPQLPYITRVVEAAFPEFERAASRPHRGLLTSINEPCLLELIWSYWHEEGMLMQTMNAIGQRFQNIRRPSERDPLLNMEIDPLRPVNNLLWGFIQDEQNRLSVARRAHEYLNEYGLPIYGRATSMHSAAETRSKFLEAFNNLLHQSSVFFKEDFQTTVIADGFPLLNALKEVHLILAQGANNQFGDLPWTARAEMLISEYVLSRPEIRDFLQGRVMVPYKEAWMPQVDIMKTLQGWSDVTVTHFRDLGVFGEQLLLSIRYGDWIDINDENSAKNWARYWRPEIQGYLHAYRAATGIDLTNPDTVDSTIPAVLLQKRMGLQQRAR
jgi:hypothetical protein